MPPTNDRVRLSNIAISRLQEAMYNAGAALALSLQTDKETSIPNPTWQITDNTGRAGGKEYPDRITDSFRQGYALPFSFDYLQPHEAEAMFAYALGARDAGSVSLGQGVYRKTYYSSDARERPSCALGAQLSADSPVNKLLLYGAKCDTLTFEGARADRHPKISAEFKTSGKQKQAVFSENVLGSSAATSLTLGRAIEGPAAGGAPEAADRLDSVHRVLADVDGDGSYEEPVHVVAASDANPSVLTIVAPSREPYRVFLSDAGVKTDYSDAANSTTGGDVPVGLVFGQDYLYLGFRERIASFFVDVTAANAAVDAMVLEYWTGSAWAAVANLSDGTLSGGAALAVDGTVQFTMPTDWNRSYEGADGAHMSLFWLRMSPTAIDWTGSTTIAQIYGSPSLKADKVVRFEGTTYTDETADAANLLAGTVDLALTTTGYLYIGSLRPFGGLRVDLDGANVNAVTATFAAGTHYWNGSAWTALTPTDGTIATGKTLAQDGDITWTAPTASVKVAGNAAGAFATVMPSSIPGYDVGYHWIRLRPSASLTAGTAANSLRLLAKQVYYRCLYRARESLYLTEMATMPSEMSDESPLMNAMAQLLLGGKFDGANLERGFGFGCDLETFSLALANNHADGQSCWMGEGDGEYSDEMKRGDPENTITINRRLIDWLIQNGIQQGDYFSAHWEYIGDIIEGTNPPMRPRLVVHCDRCWYTEASVGQNEGRYTEDATIRVGQSDDWPAVVVVVENQDSVGFAVAA